MTHLSDILEGFGLVAILVGVYLVAGLALALVIGGCLVLAAGVLLDARKSS